jgi:pimeloyl-ACP methyl ester carboxylesterase
MPFLKLSDVDLYYEVEGKGPPILFISSTASDGKPWRAHQAPELRNDFTVVTFDMRGTGKTVNPSGTLTVKAIAEDAAALLRHVDAGPAVVVGHSMGGRMAQVIALDHPDLVRKLIFCSSGSPKAQPGGLPLGICVEMIEQGFHPYVRAHALEVGWTKEFIAANRKIVDDFIDSRIENLPPLKTYLEFILARQKHDVAHRLKEIKVPTLVLVGDDEDHSNSGHTHVDAAKELAAAIPGARFQVLPGQGHFYAFAEPRKIAKIFRDFIAER